MAANALSEIGHEVSRFSWNNYFNSTGLPIWRRYWLRAQNKYLWGPQVIKLNRDLLAHVAAFQPDVIFIYRGTHIFPTTLRELHSVASGVVIVGYNNDDPFARGHIAGLWRHFVGGLPELDLALAYRHENIDDFYKHGARRVELLRSWYVPSLNFPRELSPEERLRFECDVVFIGHFEPDMRLSCLEEIVSRGWRLRLFGHQDAWEPHLKASQILSKLAPVHTVWGSEYNAAICGAKIALCFLSKLNRDSYTRRCFEIPASGAMLLSERTADLEGLYQAGTEADYFSTPDELAAKLDMYLRDDVRRKAVAVAGRKRVMEDGHDVVSRMRTITKWVEEIKVSRK